MRKNIFFLSLTLISLINCYGQDFSCGHDAVTNIQKQNIPDLNSHFLRVQESVKSYIDFHYKSSQEQMRAATTPTTYYIPVVFHIVHPGGDAYGSGVNISYAQVVSQINAMNAAFSRSYPTYNGQTHPSYAQNVDIQFCLAKTPMPANASFYAGPQGTEFGVMRYANTAASQHSISNASANALLGVTHPNASYFPFSNYLNIWVVQSIGSGPGTTMGYAPTPLMNAYPLDGVIMRSDVVGDNSAGGNFSLGYGLDQGKVMVHEVGHYLNLYHIFQNGCSGMNAANAPNDACDLNGDFCCDTDPCTTQNISCNLPIPNTCQSNYNTGTTSSDMINDYMSYADDNCMNTFTNDQKLRMWATMNLMRFNLWQTTNLSATGVIGTGGCIAAYLMSDIQKSTNNLCAGSSFTLSNLTSGNSATSRSWNLPGAIPSTASGTSVLVSYATPGNYTAYLTVNNGTASSTGSLLIQVANCAIDSSKLDRSHWYFGNYAEIDFTTNPPSAGNSALTFSTMFNGFESTVSMSDKRGNLLFYTSSIDMWNSSHAQVNTQNVFQSWSSTPGILSIPYPGDSSRYIVVTSPHTGGYYDSLYYVVYNTLTQTVTTKRGFAHPLLPPAFGEPLTIVPHCNGQDFWILARPIYSLSTYDRAYALLLTPAGPANIQTVVVSQGLSWGISGQWKANSKGNRLVHAVFGSGGLGVLQDFDNATGRITNETGFGQTGNLTSTGAIFSPNDSIVYLMRSFGANYINITKTNVNSLATQTVLSYMLGYKGLQFECGPDNNIYCSQGEYNTTSIARLNNPNSWQNVTYVPNVITYTGNCNPFGGMCNFMDAKKPAKIAQDFNAITLNCSTKKFMVDSCWQIYTASWQFGDGGTASGLVAQHSYTAAGNYAVVLRLSVGSYSLPPITKNIVILSPTISIVGPTVMCQGAPFPNVYSTGNAAGATYSWSVSNGGLSGPSNMAYANVFGGTSGVMTVSVTVNQNACLSAGSKTVLIDNAQASLAALPPKVCVNDVVPLNGSPAGGVYSGPGVTGSSFVAANSGTFTVQYTYANANNCSGTASQTISVAKCSGIEENNTNARAKIYPNPGEGIFMVEISGTASCLLKVYNVLGELVKTEHLQSNISTLDMRDSSAGLYFCVLEQSGQRELIRLVKLK